MRKLGLTRQIKRVVLAAALLVSTACTKAPSPTTPPNSGASMNPADSAPPVASSTTDAGVGSSPNPGASTLSFDATVQNIELKLGARFSVNLPANITTPYKWVIASAETHVRLAERHYSDTPPADCAGCVGYPGTDRLTFEALQAGSTQLVLRYAPLRSKTDPPQRELTINIKVTEH